MYVEAVTVCVGYADFLAAAAPWNAPLFDRWVVVTEAADLATRDVCRRHSLDCLLSDEGKEPGGFNKGRLVERGLQHLSADGWRLHLDADVVLPSRFRHRLAAAALDEAAVYGVDRVLVRSWGEWRKLVESGYLQDQHDYHNRLRFPPGLPVGTRWVGHDVGYVPIGFFQLWHSSQDQWRGARVRPYPRRHNTACRTDVQHGLQWDRARRQLLPDVVAVHLESEPAPLGANWKGRTTRPFGPAGGPVIDGYA